MRKQPLVGLVASIAIAGGLAIGWWLLRATDTDAGPLVLYGNVDIRQVELAFRVGGRIATMHFEEGDRIASGALLAELDAKPFLDELALRKALTAEAAANLERLERGSRPEEIKRAEDLVLERRATLRNVEQTLERQRRLFEQKVVPAEAYDEALAARDEAAARLASARAALELAREGFRVEDVAAGRAALEAARARLQAAETALEDTRLASPADGIILVRVREPGAIVASGATVYTLSLDRPTWVRAYVPEPALGRIELGMRAEVATDTEPDHPYLGHVGFVSPVAEFTPRSVQTPELRTDLVYRLRIIVDEPGPGLRQGMPVTVKLGNARREGSRQ